MMTWKAQIHNEVVQHKAQSWPRKLAQVSKLAAG